MRSETVMESPDTAQLFKFPCLNLMDYDDFVNNKAIKSGRNR